MIDLNRNTQPEIKLVSKINLHQPEVVHLQNEIPVYLINTGTQDLVKIEFIFNAGNRYEKEVLVSRFSNKMLKEGTKNFSSNEIAEKIDYYGAHLQCSSEKDNAYVTLYCLNKHLEKILPVIEEVIFKPVFPEKELQILKQNQKQEFIVNSEKVKYVASWNFNELLFGKDHPYGRLITGEDFENVDLPKLVNFHKETYRVDKCKIIIAGKIPNNLVELLNKHIGIYGSSNYNMNTGEFSIKSEQEQNKHIKRDNAIQSAVRIGKILFNKKHPDFMKLKVLNTILGGYFGSRLMTNIREEKGYTYGIGSVLISLQQSGYFFITSEVGADVTQNAIDEIYKEISKLQENRIPETELNLVKNYMLGSFLRSIDGPFALSESLRGLIEYDLHNNFYENFINIIQNIGTEELRSLACKYFDKDSLYELRVGR